MLDYTFLNRTKLVFGKNAEMQIGDYAKNYGSKALLVYGGGSVKRSGLFDRIVSLLEKENIKIFELGGVKPNPRVNLCKEGIKTVKENGIDMIIAVGGGSVVDSGKCIACGAVYDGDVWDICSGEVKVPENPLPLLTVITMAGTGTEVSVGSVITDDATMLKRGFGSDYARPAVSFINPELTYTLPPYQTAAGGVDIISHCLERVMSENVDSDLSERWAIITAKTVVKFIPKALADPCDYTSHAQLSYASMYAMMGWQQFGIRTDGLMHCVEHELSAEYDVTHGAGLAVIMPAYFRYICLNGNEKQLLKAAKVMNGLFDAPWDFRDCRNTIMTGVERMESYFRSIGMPVKLGELGIDGSKLSLMAAKAVVGRDGTVGHFMPIGPEEIEKLYRIAL